jgi:hypothetical protein
MSRRQSFLAPKASECRGSGQRFLAPKASECRGSGQRFRAKGTWAGATATVLVVVAACEGGLGPPPPTPPSCDNQIIVGPADTHPLADVDDVVAAADLQVGPDGVPVLAVERWNGATWRIAAVWTDGRPAVEWRLDAPPPGRTPPLADPRLGLSPLGEPALAFRTPTADGWSIALASGVGTRVLGGAGGRQHAADWVDEATPAAVWLAADGSSVESSLARLTQDPLLLDVQAMHGVSGGLLAAVAGPTRLAFFRLAADGTVTTLVDRVVSSYGEGTLHLVRDAERAYYLGFVVRTEHDQGYLLGAQPGSQPQPVALPADGPVDSLLLAADGRTWVLAPQPDGHVLDAMARANPPTPAVVFVDGPDGRLLDHEPMAALRDGSFLVGIIRGGGIELSKLTASVECR